MMGRDLLRPDFERHGALRMTDAARPVLRGEVDIQLRRPDIRAPKSVVKALVAEEDAPILSALKAKRRALAEAAGVPAYVIFADRTLIEMAEKRPETLDQMAQISGVGAKKLESYGLAFLQVIASGMQAPHPARMALAGQAAGAVYDLLAEAQLRLARGEDGIGKHLSCNATTLRQIAERRPSSLTELERVQGMGQQKAERFGPAFLDILHRAAGAR